MLFKAMAIIITALWAVVWFLKNKESQRRPVEKSGSAGGDETISANGEVSAHPVEDPDESGEELDESQAAEVAATWNLLNPP